MPCKTLAEQIRIAASQLESVSDTPRLDAEILCAHALKISRAALLARLGESIESPIFNDLIKRRLAYEPIAYILGEWEFFSIPFLVKAPLLVPRPETEHLVEIVLDTHKKHSAPCTILDLCTGTGCVGISLAKNIPAGHITATDINPEAEKICKKNAKRHGVSKRLQFRKGDLFHALHPSDGPFDYIVCNPPYVETHRWHSLSPVIRYYEDPKALLAGEDGLDIIRRLVSEARHWLVDGGMLAFEIGIEQDKIVEALLYEQQFSSINFVKDLAGIKRIVYGWK